MVVINPSSFSSIKLPLISHPQIECKAYAACAAAKGDPLHPNPHQSV